MPNNLTATEKRGDHGYWATSGKLGGSDSSEHARYAAWVTKIRSMKKAGKKGGKTKAPGKDPANWRRDVSIKAALAKLRAHPKGGSSKGVSHPKTPSTNKPGKKGFHASAIIAACYAKACAPPPVGKGGSVNRGVAAKAARLGLLVHRAGPAPGTKHTPGASAIRQANRRAEGRAAQAINKTRTRSAGGLKLDKASRAIAHAHGFTIKGPDGRDMYPIRNAGELNSAIRLRGRSKIPRATVEAHIRKQAARLGLSSRVTFSLAEFVRGPRA